MRDIEHIDLNLIGSNSIVVIEFSGDIPKAFTYEELSNSLKDILDEGLIVSLSQKESLEVIIALLEQLSATNTVSMSDFYAKQQGG